ncbi:acetylxylan esterase [Pedobacter africanus]|nr:acetylxylan esterase [Pedobacter africanus]
MQNSDSLYRLPLKTVLAEIESRFKVKIKYNDNQVADRWVNYALWRFRPGVEETLASVLAPLDMKANREKEGLYKLKEYEYYRWQVQEGQEMLNYLSTLYQDKSSWEQRKALIRPCLYAAQQLSPMPAKPVAKPILTPKRMMEGYTVENIAIEILPGLYVNGSLYKPLHMRGKVPVVLSPDGHWGQQRYRADCQIRCAMIARMGAMAISYDLFAWGESLLQFKAEDHRRSLAQSIQTLGGIRILDYVLSLRETDPDRVGISGGSGGGSHTVLLAAMDDRIKLSIPVVSLSSSFYGGCPCESGMPIHLCAGSTNNVELAAMAAPKPQLVVSDGKDWTASVPDHDLPFLKKIYAYYAAQSQVQNVHLPEEGHDFGPSKRRALYDFLIEHFKLNGKAVKDNQGNYDESKCSIEKEPAMYVFGDKGERLPANAIKGFEQLEKVFKASISK